MKKEKADRKTREHDLHIKLAHEYDEKREGTRNGRYYSKEWLRAIINQIDLSKVKSILDIGCGTGILYEVLKEEHYIGTYVGTDLSPDMLEVGRKRYNGIDLRVMDCENMEFPSRSFDVVFMRSVLHHVPHPANAVKEMKRVARKTIIIAEPARNIIPSLPRYLSKKLTSHFDEDHTHYSVSQLQKILKKGGIEKCRLVHFGYLAYPFGFTDILPGTKYVPLIALKGLFKLDLLFSRIPLLRYFSWHLTAICKAR